MVDLAMEGRGAQLLDNPIWNALTTDHAALAVGGADAAAVSVRDRAVERDADGVRGGLGGAGGTGGAGRRGRTVFSRGAADSGIRWTVVRSGELVQMVAERPAPVAIAEPAGMTLRVLTKEDAPAMVELAELTEPGPFRLRTLELGTFFGILDGGRLLAMAGKRMHMPGFIEVSGVCTHPEARGRGYARLLMSCVMEEIMAAGRTPFLHVAGQQYGGDPGV